MARHISITPVLGVGITDLRPFLDDQVYILRDTPDGGQDSVRMTVAEAYQVRDALAQLLVDGALAPERRALSDGQQAREE